MAASIPDAAELEPLPLADAAERDAFVARVLEAQGPRWFGEDCRQRLSFGRGSNQESLERWALPKHSDIASC